jgi:hypothetical protein
MSEQPLDLRALAAVDEPEVLRDALRTFRRRVLTRYVWITLALALVLVAVLWGLQPLTLEERIEEARPAHWPATAWHRGGASIGLSRVADLGDSVGMHFVVIGEEGLDWDLQVAGSLQNEASGDGFDAYVEVPKTRDGRYMVAASSSSRPKEFIVDLSAIGVPSSIWKEGS